MAEDFMLMLQETAFTDMLSRYAPTFAAMYCAVRSSVLPTVLMIRVVARKAALSATVPHANAQAAAAAVAV